MKKIAIVVLAIFATSAFAMGPGHRGGEKMVEHMTKKLELTESQSAELSTIFKEQGEKRKSLHDETQEKINALLTPEQQEKLKQMKEKREKRGDDRREKKEKR
ncbi:hypothetical protein [Alcanivorax sp.]|uniref:hypothetical protein n=1 Tax=Alcanivorax sp. TaxID=1872427 RepID=UPI00258DBFE6|nr:hypothetical protein [Alcanivorax sp.]